MAAARTGRLAGAAVAGLALLAGGTAGAADLTGAAFTLRGATLNASGSGAAVGASLRSGVSVGQSEALGLAGSDVALTTTAPGFWPIVAGGLPALDLDADGIQAFKDPDDDNDGLLDPVETGTGVFVSADDTGSDPLDPDSDGDGLADGHEVSLGSDPNDPTSLPTIPALPIPALVWTALGVALFAALRLRRPRRS